MADLEKEKQIVLIIENAQLELKKNNSTRNIIEFWKRTT